MSFDVNKIITESIAEVINEEKFDDSVGGFVKDSATKFSNKAMKLFGQDGYWGKKAHDTFGDKPAPDSLERTTMLKLAKRNRELEGMGAKDHAVAAAQKTGKNIADTATDAKNTVVGATKKATDAAVDAKNTVVNTAKKAVGTGEDVASHLAKSFNKIKDDASEGITNVGHKVADHLANLDYGSTGLAAGGALAAGLGALALRKRMKKVK